MRPRDGVELGYVEGAGTLAYYEEDLLFVLAGHLCPLFEVRALDSAGRIRWRFLEQRDWMRRLPEGPFEESFARAETRAREALPAAERLDAELRAHAEKDTSYLHGRIVEPVEVAQTQEQQEQEKEE